MYCWWVLDRSTRRVDPIVLSEDAETVLVWCCGISVDGSGVCSPGFGTGVGSGGVLVPELLAERVLVLELVVKPMLVLERCQGGSQRAVVVFTAMVTEASPAGVSGCVGERSCCD